MLQKPTLTRESCNCVQLKSDYLSVSLQNLGPEDHSQHALKLQKKICSLITVSKLIISKAHLEDTS